MEKIRIQKDCIQFGEHIVYPPFEKEKIDSLFGEYEEKHLVNEELKIHRVLSIWNTLGMIGYLSKDLKEYETFQIRIAEGEYINTLLQGIYTGSIYIDKKEYKQCKWKEEMPFSYILKKGCFECSTFLIEHLETVPEKYKETALKVSKSFEISYIPPKKKNKNSFKYPKVEGEIVKVSDLNFKLAILQVLMYEKNLLQPKFNLYAFANEYGKREINIEEEGYEPIQEALNWFKKYPIPVEMVKEIETIYMDGGNDIYHEIYPFWDGEDDFFDIKKIKIEDVSSFENLKEMTLMSPNIKKIQEELKETNIQIKAL